MQLRTSRIFWTAGGSYYAKEVRPLLPRDFVHLCHTNEEVEELKKYIEMTVINI